MLDRGPQRMARLIAQAAPPVPVDRLIIGTELERAAELLPKLFNLCRAAQVAALRSAIGQPAQTEHLAEEILRDHLLKLNVTWPGFFGLPPQTFPDDWAKARPSLVRSLFGTARAPARPDDFDGFLRNGSALARALLQIAQSFRPGEAATPGLPAPTLATIWRDEPVENSVAARQLTHPVMRHIENSFGRGPLWRAVARIYDIDALCHGQRPDIERASGMAMVTAARGACAIGLTLSGGIIRTFNRITPTDAVLKTGGLLDLALTSLPAEKAGLGPLLVDILDPCCPVRLKEVFHA